MCQLPLPVSSCQLPHLSCHLWVCHSCRVIEICAWALRQMPKEWQWYLQHTQTHAHTLMCTCHTCAYATTFTWSSFKMQHALSELSKFVYFSSPSFLSATKSSTTKSLTKITHTHNTHTHDTHISSLPYFYYLWLLQVKWICQICLNNSRQKFLRWVLSCNLWHSLLLCQVDLISKFVFDLGNSLSLPPPPSLPLHF